MNDQKLQLIDKIKGAKNVLVTVSANPSLDQLSAAIGLTLILNKLEKHATAVYSGETPSALEFLRPEETLEKNTDSLRDFIISLDKAKADKLRYKVEERVVKIFITPYRTSLTSDDLEFSQGDFNVDVVVAIGVHFQQDLDAAITAHGRILHDAVVTTINNTPDGDLGSINWQDGSASSLSEQIASLTHDLGENLLDNQIATALLTGIVAETGRFRNTKTTPQTMSLSAELMSAGANQQLVASELEELTEPAGVLAPKPPEANANIQTNTQQNGGDQPAEQPPASNDGTLEIEHDAVEEPAGEPVEQVLPEVQESPQPQPQADLPYDGPQIGEVKTTSMPDEKPQSTYEPAAPKFVTEPPSMGGVLTANSRPEALDPSIDPLSGQMSESPLLDRSDHPQYSDGDNHSPDLAALDDSFNESKTDVGQSAQPSLASLLDNSAVSSTPPPTPSPSALPDLQPAIPNDQPPAGQAPDSDPLPVLEPLEPIKDPTAYDHETLDEIKAEIHHEAPSDSNQPVPGAEASVDNARQAVEDAIKALPDAGDSGPILALNAQPFGDDLHPAADPVAPVADNSQYAQPTPPAPTDQFTMPVPPSIMMPPADVASPTQSPNVDPSAPPPVPPPMMPPGFVNPSQQQ